MTSFFSVFSVGSSFSLLFQTVTLSSDHGDFLLCPRSCFFIYSSQWFEPRLLLFVFLLLLYGRYTDDNGNAVLHSFLLKLFQNEIGCRFPRTTAVGKTGNIMFVFLLLFVHAAARGGACAFTLRISNTLTKNSSRNDRPSISTQNQPMVNPIRVDQGQQMTASKISGGSVAQGVRSCPRRPTRFSQPDKRSILAIEEGSTFFHACSLHSSTQVCLYQTPGRGPLRPTGRF